MKNQNGKKIRGFVHIEGFGGSLACIHCHPDGKVFFIHRDGTTHQSNHLTLKECLRHVKEGHWKEFDVAAPKVSKKRVPIPILQQDLAGNITIHYPPKNRSERCNTRLRKIAEAAIKADFRIGSMGRIEACDGVAGEVLIRLCRQEVNRVSRQQRIKKK